MNLISCLHSALMCTVGKPKITPHMFPALLIHLTKVMKRDHFHLTRLRISLQQVHKSPSLLNTNYLDPASFKINHNAI